MKDYTNNSGDKKEFILNYKIEENIVGEKKIIVSMANGDKLVVPYSLENEKNLLLKMKEQVINAKGVYDKLVERADFSLILAGIEGIMINSIFLFSDKYYLLGIPGLLFLKNIIVGLRAAIHSNDLEKNNLFLKNEKLFLKDNINLNVKNKVSKKALKVINSCKNDRITLNDIDKLKKKDVIRMVDCIKRDQNLGLDYNPKKLVRK